MTEAAATFVARTRVQARASIDDVAAVSTVAGADNVIVTFCFCSCPADCMREL